MLDIYKFHTDPKTLMHGIAPASMADVVDVVKKSLASILSLAEEKEDEVISTLKWSMHGRLGEDNKIVFLVNLFVDKKSTGFITLTETADDVLISILYKDEEIGHVSAYSVPGVIDEENVLEVVNELVMTLVG